MVSQGSTHLTDSLLGETMETDETGTRVYYTREPDGQLISHTVGGSTYYYVFDGLGSTVALTDSAQNTPVTYTYDPFGFTNTSGSLDNRFKYTGGFLAATGLYHYGQRWYDPRTDRWTQEDPLNQPLNLQQANRYAYVNNDPVNLVDSSGTSIFSGVVEVVAGAGATVGSAIGFTACSAATDLIGTGHCFLATYPGFALGITVFGHGVYDIYKGIHE